MKAISLSLTKTLGYTLTLINNYLSLSRAYTKLFSYLNVSKTNATKKLNPIEVTPTTSTN